MMRYKIKHSTEYKYQEVVTTGHNRLCLEPLNLPEQILISSEIKIAPTPDEQAHLIDFFGNRILFISIYKEHTELTIQSESVLEIQPRINAERAPQSLFLWQDARTQISSQSDFYADVIQYTLPSLHIPYSEEIRNFTYDCFPEKGTLWNGCQMLMKKIFSYVEFKPGFTTVNTPVESVLKLRKGVCQDLAHLMIACLRNIGLPARYVSGYLETMPPPGKEKLVGSDASHAWVSIYFPDLGWVEFDPTNCLLPSYQHITVAYGRDYYDVAPIKGIVFSSGNQTLEVKVDVERVKS